MLNDRFNALGRFTRLADLVEDAVPATELALAYRDRVTAAAGTGFSPLMTLYLTDSTTPEEIRRAADAGL